MDLAGSFDKVLQMGPGEKVSQGHEFAMVFVFDVDNSPTVLTSSYRTAPNHNRVLTANHSEWDHGVDVGIHAPFLLVLFVVVVRIHAKVVECEFLLYSLLEGQTLLQSKRIRFGDDRDNIDNVRELLQDNNVNWL